VKSCSLVITMSAVSGAGEGGGAGGGVRPGVCTATGDIADTGALAVDMVAVDVLGDVDVVCVDVDVLSGVDVDIDVLGGVVEVVDVDVDVLGGVVPVVAAAEVTMTTVSGEVSITSATLATDRLVLVLALVLVSGALLEVLEMVIEVVTLAANVVVSAFVSSGTVVTGGASSDVVDTGVCGVVVMVETVVDPGVVAAVVTLGDSVRDCIHT